ncbi:MAG: hypothetical protein EZS28_032879, partial [Streblomastix strix]
NPYADENKTSGFPEYIGPGM